MHTKIIRVAAFRIIGLTKIPKIEFLPLDWIYRSVRIMTVIACAPFLQTIIRLKTKGAKFVKMRTNLPIQ